MSDLLEGMVTIGIRKPVLEKMTTLLDEVQHSGIEHVYGLTVGPRWSWDGEFVGGHLSVSFRDGSGCDRRTRWTLDTVGNVLWTEHC